MKSILIFAGIAGIAAAVAIYFVTQNDNNQLEDEADDFTGSYEDIENYDVRENTGPAVSVGDGFRPAY